MIEFDAESHTYTLGGAVVPSVTRILKPLSEAEYRGVQAEVMARAALLGTAVHALIELDIAGTLDEDALDDTLRPYLAQWRKFRALSGFEPILSESIVYSERYGYAGKLDLFGALRGRRAMIDAKRTAKVPRSAGPQTAGYTLALRHCRPDLCPPGGAIDRYALHLKPGHDLGWELVPLKAANDERVFLSQLTCHQWMNAA